MRAVILLLGAEILGLTGGCAGWKLSHPSPDDVATAPAAPSAKPGQTSADVEQSVHYADCEAVRTSGKAPCQPGQPGYRQGHAPALGVRVLKEAVGRVLRRGCGGVRSNILGGIVSGLVAAGEKCNGSSKRQRASVHPAPPLSLRG